MHINDFLERSKIGETYPEASVSAYICHTPYQGVLTAVFDAIRLAEADGCGKVSCFLDYPALWRKLAKEIAK